LKGLNLERLKENLEFDIANSENKNESKLLYRLDKREPLCVAIDLFLCLSVFWIPLLFIIAYKIHFISLIALWFEIFILQILYSVLFFDYVEIYENKIVYADIFGLKYILNNNELHWYGAYSRLSPETVFIDKKRKIKVFMIFPFIIISSLTFEQHNELMSNIMKFELKKF
jgi:hypothetical protein